MSDLINRQNAIDALGEKPVGDTDWDLGCRNQWEWDTEILRTLPSAEPKTAKVEKQKKVYESSNHMFAYETWGECGNCGEPVKQGANYCSWCGMKLDWSNNSED